MAPQHHQQQPHSTPQHPLPPSLHLGKDRKGSRRGRLSERKPRVHAQIPQYFYPPQGPSDVAFFLPDPFFVHLQGRRHHDLFCLIVRGLTRPLGVYRRLAGEGLFFEFVSVAFGFEGQEGEVACSTEGAVMGDGVKEVAGGFFFAAEVVEFGLVGEG